jgi:hypothetical protein
VYVRKIVAALKFLVPQKKSTPIIRKGKPNSNTPIDSPFSMGPPSSSDRMESEPPVKNVPVRKEKQHKYLEIDESNPYHPIMISNSNPDPNSLENNFDPFGLGRNSFEEVILSTFIISNNFSGFSSRK